MTADALQALENARHARPRARRHLWDWVRNYTGISIPHAAVCEGHSAPFDFFAQQVLERPRLALWHGPRGSGKSFLSGLDTHVTSRFNPRHGTRILGGSGAQSMQVYLALQAILLDGKGPAGTDRDTVKRLLTSKAEYHNGSMVDILTASPTSVRGPHVPSLKLDEVDEIKPELRESAVGICMEQHGSRASILMTSTWHKIGGPMAELIDKGRAGAYPVHTYCIFEVLERCPEERSGPNLENCPACPIVKWCHADRDRHPSGLPKAKRSRGHYTIDAFIQKAEFVSDRVMESDYLCLRPRAAGTWFPMFNEALHVKDSAEYDPHRPVHLAIDPGVHTGAVWFQVHKNPHTKHITANVFADYYHEASETETSPAEHNARSILEMTRQRCGASQGPWLRVSMDPSSKARNGSGPIVRGEYERAGVRGRTGIESWINDSGSVADTLTFLETLLKSASGGVRLTIHPRCRRLIEALASYARAKRGGQWQDYPEDPQHPHEEMVDSLRCGLKLEHPEGRTPDPNLRSIHAARV